MAAPLSSTTKQRLPADYRGTWIEGTKGNGVFRYNDSIENQRAGIAGKEVRFGEQHIAVGGFPSESYYGGDATEASVEIGKVTGTSADAQAADAAMRNKLENPEWSRPEGYQWNHAGPPGSKVMELVKEGTHSATAHKGAAAELRAMGRAAKTSGAAGRVGLGAAPASAEIVPRSGGAPEATGELPTKGNLPTGGVTARNVTGRAMGALTVYLTARDALQATGVLQPTFTDLGEQEYHFVADDKSVFIVKRGWLSDPKREYIAGPRQGQVETITDAQADEHQKQAESVWGKRIRGSLTTPPRFIPGSKRKTLPIYDDYYGVPREIGYVDEEGPHYYPIPMKPIA